MTDTAEPEPLECEQLATEAGIRERLERDGGLRGKESAVLLLKALVSAGGSLYAVYAGYTLYARYDQDVSAAVWFFFLVARTLFEAGLADGAVDKAAVVLQVGALHRWWLLRGPVPRGEARAVAHRASGHQAALMRWLQDVPLLFVSTYQTVEVVLGTGGASRSLTLERFAIFAASTLHSSFSTVQTMLQLELEALFASGGDGERLSDRERRVQLRAMGLEGPRRYLTVLWRMLSLTARLIGFSCFLNVNNAADKAQGQSSSAAITILGYNTLAYFCMVFWYDDHGGGDPDVLVPRKLLPRQRHGRLCGKCRGGGGDADGDGKTQSFPQLALWNLLAPVEQPNFFPMPTTWFRLSLVLVFELTSLAGVVVGYGYAEFAQADDELPNEVVARDLFYAIFGAIAANVLAFLAWMVAQRRYAWPLHRCCGGGIEHLADAPLLASAE